MSGSTEKSNYRLENAAIAVLGAVTLIGIALSMTVFKDPDFHLDLDYLAAIQSFREWSHGLFNKFMLLVTEMGAGKLSSVIMVAIFFGFSTRLGRFVVQTVCYGEMMNGLIKLTVCAFRPWVRDELLVPPGNAIKEATGYSFPSGHSTKATAIYGATIVKSLGRSKTLVVVAGTVLFLVLFSRNYLTVHTPQDVIIGFVSMMTLILILNKVFRWVETGNVAVKKWLVFAVSVVISIAATLYFELKSYPQLTDASGKLIVDPAVLVLDSYKGIGYYLGAASTMIFTHYFKGYEAEKAGMEQRLGMTLIGILVFFLLNTSLAPMLSSIIPAKKYVFLTAQFLTIFGTFAILPVAAARLGVTSERTEKESPAV